MSTQIERERRSAIAMVIDGQAALEASLQTADLDTTARSILPGWTVGHVLTHLARNADSHLQMLDGEQQYRGDGDERDAAIESGASRPAIEIVADLVESSQALIERWAQIDLNDNWDGMATFADGATVKRSALPMFRLREVLIHRLDLGLGDVSYADLPSEFVRRELRRLTMVYNARHSMGMGGLPTAVLDLEPFERVAWLLGRRSVDGVTDPTR